MRDLVATNHLCLRGCVGGAESTRLLTTYARPIRNSALMRTNFSAELGDVAALCNT